MRSTKNIFQKTSFVKKCIKKVEESLRKKLMEKNRKNAKNIKYE
jgi:hypothetical protein